MTLQKEILKSIGLKKNDGLLKSVGLIKSLFYPTAGLQVIVYNQTYEVEGTTYYRTSTGVGLPVISGTGLDTIIDFAPLSDARLDKGSYVGNAFGLPATYDFPYVNIYYDATSAATRKHWKLKDFHYANILSQSLLVDNQFFLKATATTTTSNVIATIDRLLIYSASQTGTALSKLKTYIGIQDTFYGDNLLANPNFDTDTSWLKGTGWSINLGKAIHISGASGNLAQGGLVFLGGDTLFTSFELSDYASGIVYLQISGGGGGRGTNRSANGIYEQEIVAGSTSPGNSYFIADATFAGKIDNSILKKKYANYYKP